MVVTVVMRTPGALRGERCECERGTYNQAAEQERLSEPSAGERALRLPVRQSAAQHAH
jgi:hypothetical protein